MQYKIAGGLLVIGIVLWAITWLTNRGSRAKKTGFRDIDHAGGVTAAGSTRPRRTGAAGTPRTRTVER